MLSLRMPLSILLRIMGQILYQLWAGNMNKEQISHYLKKFIEENGLTQEQFAHLISAPLSSVSNWILGKRNMSPAWKRLLMEKKVLPESEGESLDFHY